MSAAAPDGEAGGLSGGSAPLSIPQCRSESAGRPCVCEGSMSRAFLRSEEAFMSDFRTLLGVLQ
jgi:hypothetical protein